MNSDLKICTCIMCYVDLKKNEFYWIFHLKKNQSRLALQSYYTLDFNPVIEIIKCHTGLTLADE